MLAMATLLLIYDELQFYPEGFLRYGSNYMIRKKSGLTMESEETRFAEYQLSLTVIRNPSGQNPKYCQDVSENP